MSSIGGDDLARQADEYAKQLQSISDHAAANKSAESTGKKLYFDKGGKSHTIQKGFFGSINAKIKRLESFETHFSKKFVQVSKDHDEFLNKYLEHVTTLNPELASQLAAKIADSIALFDKILRSSNLEKSLPSPTSQKEKDPRTSVLLEQKGQILNQSIIVEKLYGKIKKPLENSSTQMSIKERLVLIKSGYDALQAVSERFDTPYMKQITKSYEEFLNTQIQKCIDSTRSALQQLNKDISELSFHVIDEAASHLQERINRLQECKQDISDITGFLKDVPEQKGALSKLNESLDNLTSHVNSKKHEFCNFLDSKVKDFEVQQVKISKQKDEILENIQRYDRNILEEEDYIKENEQSGSQYIQDALKLSHFEIESAQEAKEVLQGAKILFDVHNGVLSESDGLNELNKLNLFQEVPQQGLKDKAFSYLVSDEFSQKLESAQTKLNQRITDLQPNIASVKTRGSQKGPTKKTFSRTSKSSEQDEAHFVDKRNILRSEILRIENDINSQGEAILKLLSFSIAKYSKTLISRPKQSDWLQRSLLELLKPQGIRTISSNFQNVPSDIMMQAFQPREAFSKTELARLQWIEHKIKESIGRSDLSIADFKQLEPQILESIINEGKAMSKSQLKKWRKEQQLESVQPELFSRFVNTLHKREGLKALLEAEVKMQKLASKDPNSINERAQGLMSTCGFVGTVEEWVSKDQTQLQSELQARLNEIKTTPRQKGIKENEWKNMQKEKYLAVEQFRVEINYLKELRVNAERVQQKRLSADAIDLEKLQINQIHQRCEHLKVVCKEMKTATEKITHAKMQKAQAQEEMRSMEVQVTELQDALTECNKVRSVLS